MVLPAITLPAKSAAGLTFTERYMALTPIVVVHVFITQDLKFVAITTFFQDPKVHLAVAQLTTIPPPIFAVVTTYC